MSLARQSDRLIASVVGVGGITQPVAQKIEGQYRQDHA